MAIGGFISSWLIPTFGWHSLFLLGGWSPLILMLLVIFCLPESYRFLIVKGKTNVTTDALRQELKGVMRQIRKLSPLQEDNFSAAFEILLRYYDKLYSKSLQNREALNKLLVTIPAQNTGAENVELVKTIKNKNHVS